MLVGVLRVRPKHFAIRDAAHAELTHRTECGLVGRGIGERRGSCCDSLCDAEQRCVEELRVAELSGGGGERAHPLEERKASEQAAHRSEIEMRVRVHQAWREERVAQLFVAAAGSTWRVYTLTYPDDAIVLSDDAAIRNRWRGHRNHPARVPADARRHQGKIPPRGHSCVGSVPAMKNSVRMLSEMQPSPARRPVRGSIGIARMPEGRGQSGGVGFRA